MAFLQTENRFQLNPMKTRLTLHWPLIILKEVPWFVSVRPPLFQGTFPLRPQGFVVFDQRPSIHPQSQWTCTQFHQLSQQLSVTLSPWFSVFVPKAHTCFLKKLPITKKKFMYRKPSPPRVPHAPWSSHDCIVQFSTVFSAFLEAKKHFFQIICVPICAVFPHLSLKTKI